MTHDYTQVFYTDKPEWQKVLEIFAQYDKYPKKRVRNRAYHHKFPKSFSRMLNEPVDNEPDNIVSLPFAQHLIIHYYYYILAKSPYKYRMALAFKYMIDTTKQDIKEITQETIDDLALEYQNAVILANEYSSKIRKGKPVSLEQRQRISNTLKGHSVSEESRRKNGEAHKGHKWSAEQKANLSAIRKGHPDYLTDEGRERIRISNRLNKLGTTVTEETRKKMSESQKGKHSGPRKPLTAEQKLHLSQVLKGRKFSDEHKKKLSESAKGRVISKEQRDKLSKALTGHKRDPSVTNKMLETKKRNGTLKFSEEHKRKISKALKGRKMSEESKAKMRGLKLGKHWKLVNGVRVWD